MKLCFTFIITIFLFGCNEEQSSIVSKSQLNVSDFLTKKSPQKINDESISQKTIIFPSDLVVESINVNYYSDNTCQNIVEKFNMGGGEYKYSAGEYLTRSEFLFNLCSAFSSGCKAEFSEVGSIRFDYNIDSGKNTIQGNCSTTKIDTAQNGISKNIIQNSKSSFCDSSKDCGFSYSSSDIVTKTPEYLYGTDAGSSSYVYQCQINPKNYDISSCIKYDNKYATGATFLNINDGDPYFSNYSDNRILKCNKGSINSNYNLTENCNTIIKVGSPQYITKFNETYYVANSNLEYNLVYRCDLKGDCNEEYNSNSDNMQQPLAIKIYDGYAYIVNNTNVISNNPPYSPLGPLRVVKCDINSTSQKLENCKPTGIAFETQYFMYDINFLKAQDGNVYAYFTTEAPDENGSYFDIYKCKVDLTNGELSDKCDVAYKNNLNIGSLVQITFNSDNNIMYLANYNGFLKLKIDKTGGLEFDNFFTIDEDSYLFSIVDYKY